MELAQERDAAVLAELAHGLAHEAHQLGRDLVVRRLPARRGRPARASSHGLPWAARPTMTASQPVVCSSASARRAAVDVAGRDHGHVDERHQLGRQRVVGRAGVHLLGGARVQRQRRGAGLDQPRAGGQGVARAVALAAAHLHRHRHVDRAGDGLDDAARPASPPSASSVQPAPVLVTLRTGQPMLMSTRSAPASTTMRAASASSGGSEPKICTASGRSSARDAQVAERALVAVVQAVGGDHLRAHQPGAEAAALAAEGLHGDAGHGREHDPARDLDGADRTRCRSGVRAATATPTGYPAGPGGADGARCYIAALRAAPPRRRLRCQTGDVRGEGNRPHA